MHYPALSTWAWDRELGIYSKIVKDMGRIEVRPYHEGFTICIFLHKTLPLQSSYSSVDAALKDADLWISQIAENAAHTTRIVLDAAVERPKCP